MRNSSLQFAFLVALVGLFLWRESFEPVGAAIDAVFADWLAANARRQPPAAAVTLIEIDEASLGDDHPWPWPPLDCALFFQAVEPVAPAVLAVAEVLDWNERSGGAQAAPAAPSAEQLAMLHAALLRAPGVVLAATLGASDDPDLVPPQTLPVLRHVKGRKSELPDYGMIVRQPPEMLRLSPKLGFVNIDPETADDATARAVPLLYRCRGEVVPSLALQAAMLWYGVTPEQTVVRPGTYIDLGGRTRLPIDRAGRLRIDFRVPLNRHGFGDLLLAAEQRGAGRTPIAPDAALAGRAVVLGRTDAATRTLEFPNGKRGSRAELFAHGLATILAGSRIHRCPWPVDAGLILAAAAVAPLLLRLRRGGAVRLLVVLLALYLFGAITVFAITEVWLPLTLPLGLALFAAGWRFTVPRQPAPAR